VFALAAFRIIVISCDMACDLRCACPLFPGPGPKDGGKVGEGRTPSPFVGEVDISPILLPVFPSPPMNSLVPRLCDPGLDGIVLGCGDCGGLCIPKENVGSGGGRGRLLSTSGGCVVFIVDPPVNSKAGKGRLPVPLENDDGAEDGDEGKARAGKTKDGRGRGPGPFTGGVGSSTRAGDFDGPESSRVLRKAPLRRSVSFELNDILPCTPCEVERAVMLPTPHGGQLCNHQLK
jgi:hypothetical protein